MELSYSSWAEAGSEFILVICPDFSQESCGLHRKCLSQTLLCSRLNKSMCWSKHIYLHLCWGNKGWRKEKSMLSVAEFLVVFHKAVAWLISYLQTRQNGPAAFLLCWTVWIISSKNIGLALLLLLLLCPLQPFTFFLLFAFKAVTNCVSWCLFMATPLPSSPGLWVTRVNELLPKAQELQ